MSTACPAILGRATEPLTRVSAHAGDGHLPLADKSLQQGEKSPTIVRSYATRDGALGLTEGIDSPHDAVAVSAMHSK